MVSPTVEAIGTRCSSAELAPLNEDGARSDVRASTEENHQPEGQRRKPREKTGNGQRCHGIVERTISFNTSNWAPYQQSAAQRTEDSGRDTQAKGVKAQSSGQWRAEAQGRPEKV